MKTETEIKEKIASLKDYITTFEPDMPNHMHHEKLMEIKLLEWILE